MDLRAAMFHSFVIFLVITPTVAKRERSEQIANSDNRKKDVPSGMQKSQRNSSDDEMIPCDEHADCDNPMRICSCQQSCELFGDCCNFYFRKHSWTEKQRVIVSEHKKCILLPEQSMWGIDTCPGNTSTAVTANNTSQLFDILPVTDRFNITYKNKKIAECHGVSDHLSWRMAISNVKDKCQHESRTIMAKSIIDVMSEQSLTSQKLTNLISENSCSVLFYPPEGRSSHYCFQDVVVSRDCLPIYRPVYNRQTTSPVYQNLECCQKYNSCLSEYKCVTRRGYTDNPFEYFRGESKKKSSMVLLDLNKKSDTKDFTLQYMNIRYEKLYSFFDSRRIDRQDMHSVYCLLRQYFESLTNAIGIEKTIITYYQVQNGSQSHSYMTSFWLLFNSQRLFPNIDDVEKLHRWLDVMEVKVTIQVSNISHDINLTDRGNIAVQNITESIIYLFSPSKRMLPNVHDWLIKRNALCRYLHKTNTSPRRLCEYLHVKAITNGDAYEVEWTCKTWDDKLRELKNIAMIFDTIIRNGVVTVFTSLCCLLVVFQ